MQKRSRSQQKRPGDHAVNPPTRGAMTRMLRELGPVVYAVRVGDLIKIGHTKNLANRCRTLSVTYDALLGWRPGTLADELAIHESLSRHVVRGREWYPPVGDVLAVVNDMRGGLGIEPVAA